jgi:hypothetical protein
VLLEVMILTIEAIEGASMIEDSQVFIPMLRASRNGISRVAAPCSCGADEVRDAVGGQRVVVV